MMMQHLSSTSFGRRTIPHGQNSEEGVDKWQVLQHLRLIRGELDLSDRSLSVLAALMSFLPARALVGGQPLIVWPSNATLGQRANGMPESTLRRHLSHLVHAGLITRHASPNGKRYARRTLAAEGLLAYGFSLEPLRQRAPEFAEIAHEVELRAIAIRDLRDAITLSLREAEATLPQDQRPALDLLRKSLRRALPLGSLQQLLTQVRALLPAPVSPQMSGSDGQNERHIQESIHINIDKDSAEIADETSLTSVENAMSHSTSCQPSTQNPRHTNLESLSCEKVLDAFPNLQDFSPERITSWSALHKAADLIAPMIGLTPPLIARAKQAFGADGTALAISALLQKFDKLRNPAAYLTHLLTKAQMGHFSPHSLLPSQSVS